MKGMNIESNMITRKREILSRMRKYAKVLVSNNQINQYIKMAVQKCMKSTIRKDS